RRNAQSCLAPQRVFRFFHIAEEPAEVDDARGIRFVELDASFQPILAGHPVAPCVNDTRHPAPARRRPQTRLLIRPRGRISTTAPTRRPPWINSVRRPKSVDGSRIQNTPMSSWLGVIARNARGRLM